MQELAPLAEARLNLSLQPGVSQRLCDYALAVANYRGAVKELPWRNGWFLGIAVTPQHRHYLEAVGIPVG